MCVRVHVHAWDNPYFCVGPRIDVLICTSVHVHVRNWFRRTYACIILVLLITCVIVHVQGRTFNPRRMYVLTFLSVLPVTTQPPFALIAQHKMRWVCTFGVLLKFEKVV